MSHDVSAIEPAKPKSRRSRRAIELEYISVARDNQAKPSSNTIEIDDDPRVSTSEAGAWVAAWVWVDCEEVGLRRRWLPSAAKPKKKPAKFQA
jgi:hypothetical protein